MPYPEHMANLGAYPFNPATPVGKTRLLIGDTDPVLDQMAGQGEYLWYSDSELTALLGMFGENPARTASHVLRTIGLDEAMLLKKFSSADLTVDGPAIARTFFEAARNMDTLADRIDAGLDAEHSFGVVPTRGVSVEALITRDTADLLRATWGI